MRNMTIVELKPYVPAKNFALSKRFYQDLGFELAWSFDDLAYLRHGDSSSLLQRSYKKEPADNFMMHLLVEDVEARWSHVQDLGLVATYRARAEPPSHRSWGIPAFVIIHPTRRLWPPGPH